MKKIFAWILSLSLLMGGSYAAGKYWKEKREKGIAQESPDFDNGFRPADFPLHNRSFALIISGFNNGAFVEKSLRSIFAQAYENYRIIYIDDASTDGSSEVAKDCIYASSQMGRTTFIRNETRLGPLANLSRAVQTCQDDEIVVVLNGEDFLAHEWTLSRLNQYYADPDLWLTYGQFCEFPSYRLGFCRAYKQSEWATLRQAPFAASHLKTFYAGLFKKIAEADLALGSFLPQAADLAIMLPMLEMAEGHFQFISEILYIANRLGAMHVDREQMARVERQVRSQKSYAPLADFRTGDGA